MTDRRCAVRLLCELPQCTNAAKYCDITPWGDIYRCVPHCPDPATWLRLPI